MSQVEDGIDRDFHIAMDAEMFSDIFSLMSTLIQIEVQIQLRNDGLYLQQMDEARVGMTVMFIPKHYFKELKAGKYIKELRLQVTELKAILKRLSHGDVIDFSVKEAGKLHIEIQGKRIRAFNLPPLEPEELERRLPKVVPNVRIKTTMEGLLYAMEDVNDFLMSGKKRKDALGQILIKTMPMGLKLEASTEDGMFSTDATLNSGWDIMQFTGGIDQRVAIALVYGIDIIKSVSKITNIVQLEFSTDFPLRIIAELPFKGAELEFWLAPRIDVVGEAKAVVPKTEVKK